MFSELTKPLSQEFLIGYLLPAFLFVVGAVLIGNLFQADLVDGLAGWAQDGPLTWALTVTVTVIFSIAMGLLVLNLPLLRLLQGYFKEQRNPLTSLHRRRLRKLLQKISQLEEKYCQEMAEGEVSQDTRQQYGEYLLRRCSCYPLEEAHVLPTSFGNVVRAFEVYSREMYGLDAIPAWPRILAVVPESFRKIVNEEKAIVDFAVNWLFLMALMLLEYSTLAVIYRSTPRLGLVLLAGLALTYGSYYLAVASAKQWGEVVKSVFDLYRGQLLEHLGLEAPTDLESEKELWIRVSQSFLYWSPPNMPRRSGAPVSNPQTLIKCEEDEKSAQADYRFRGCGGCLPVKRWR